MFLQGAGITLLISLTGTVVGFVIGLGVGYVRAMPCDREDGLARYWLLKIARTILGVYIEVFRSTPMIVQAMVIFYGMASVFHINLPHLLAGFVIVSINTGAYLSEIVRGGIQSVDPGQQEAALAIGMTYGKTMAESCEIGAMLAASVIVTTESVCPRFLPRELGLDMDVVD